MPNPFDRLIEACHHDWRAYIEHEFVRRLGDGSLPEASFRHYLEQDYLFLGHFARAWALALYKSRDFDELRDAFDRLKTIVDLELGLHLDYCAQWGIDVATLDALPEARATLAYTRYVLDAGARGDLLELRVALAPCLVGYARIGKWLASRAETRLEGNPYAAWIEMYTDDAYLSAASEEEAWLDQALAEQPAKRIAELEVVFRDATRLEIDFWQMGLERHA